MNNPNNPIAESSAWVQILDLTNQNENVQLEHLPIDSILSQSVLSDSLESDSLEESQNNSVRNMANQTTESLIAAARSYGEIIPKFEGKANTLENFIAKADKYYEKYGNTDDDTLTDYVFCMLSNKLINEANDFAICRPDLTDWPMLKAALRNKFGDFTDRKVLTHQFKNLKLKYNEPLNEFLERIRALQTQLDIKIQMEDSLTQEQKTLHKEINEQTALEILYNNCPQMLQTIIDVKAHTTLTQATSTILNFVAKHPTMRESKNSGMRVTNTPLQPVSAPQRENTRAVTVNNSNNYPSAQRNFNTVRFNQPPQMSNFGARRTNQLPTQTSTSNHPGTRTNFAPSRFATGTNNTPTTSNLRPNTTNVQQSSTFRNWRQPKSQINMLELTQMSENDITAEANEFVAEDYYNYYEPNSQSRFDDECQFNNFPDYNEVSCSDRSSTDGTENILENFRVLASDNETNA